MEELAIAGARKGFVLRPFCIVTLCSPGVVCKIFRIYEIACRFPRDSLTSDFQFEFYLALNLLIVVAINIRAGLKAMKTPRRFGERQGNGLPLGPCASQLLDCPKSCLLKAQQGPRINNILPCRT